MVRGEEIVAQLREIEASEGVRIVYAVESGSRGWGFPSADSDYDVRFLYLRPTPWYLSIEMERRRDVIERPIADELDINGWDLRKALNLFGRSNPPLFEWLSAPIVYHESSSVLPTMRRLAPRFYDPRPASRYYLQMADKQYAASSTGEPLRLKPFFYALRGTLALRWLEQGRGIVPMAFGTLVETIVESEEMAEAIWQLVALKRERREVESGPRVALLCEWVEQELARQRAAPLPTAPVPGTVEELDALFLGALAEVNGE